MIRIIFVILMGVILSPFFWLFRKQLNSAKRQLNEAGVPATFKNIFFMEAAIAEAERKKKEALLAEFGDQIDQELAEAKAKRGLAAGQQVKVG